MSEKFATGAFALEPIEGGITAPQGFTVAGVAAGIKKSPKKDVALMFSESETTTAAAVFTTNRMAAAPVVISKRHMAEFVPRAIVANSGNANACTGPEGMADAVSMARTAAGELDIDPHEVIVASTGVIGTPLPMDAVTLGVKMAAMELGIHSNRAAEAIMTTDTFPKEMAVEFELDGVKTRIGGIAKGSGMIRPDMATMLAFLTTDAAVEQAFLKESLRKAIDVSFNMITVDGESSTNDMVALLAGGASGGATISATSEGSSVSADGDPASTFEAALAFVCTELAKMIARDGEGATKFVEVRVDGAASDADAKRAALAIANSPLVKTALFAEDPNWGRIASAVGASGTMLDPAKVAIRFGTVVVAEDGAAAWVEDAADAGAQRGAAIEAAAKAQLASDEVLVSVTLGVGEATATVWTCDLSYDYVKINAEYRT